MKLLLDTVAFLWLTGGHPGLSERARDLFADPANEVFLSTVSVWEIVLKYSLGRLKLMESPEELIKREREGNNIRSLPLEEEAPFHLQRLPLLHKDPFDRILVCQAITSGLTILTPDPLLSQYPVRTVW